MAQNFEWKSKSGYIYDTLLPTTDISTIENLPSLYEITSMQVEIPSTNEFQQDITIVANEKLASSKVEMYLISTGEQAILDYATIDQFSVSENKLTIIRLTNYPTASILVELVFTEKI